MKRCGGGIVFLVACLAVASSVSCSQSPPAVRESGAEISLVAQRVETPLDIVLMIDQSGSMSGTANSPATDPQDFRISASKYLVTAAAQKPGTRMGIVSFGNEAQVDAPLTELAEAEKASVLQGAIVPAKLGWTNFAGGFNAAMEVFRSAGTFTEGNKPLLVVFTDGEPEDSRHLGSERYFEEINATIQQQLAPERCDVYILGIDDAGKGWSKSQPQWEAILGEDHVISLARIEQLRPEFNRIIYPEMQLDEVTTDGLSFDVPPYLDYIQFHIFPESPELKLAVRRPDGTLVDTQSDADATADRHEDFDVLIIRDPAPGKWQYEIVEGQGRVEVYRNPVPVRIVMLAPEPSVPMGRDFKLRVALVREDGSPVVPLPDYPIQLVARLSKPGAEGSADFRLERAEAGDVYEAGDPLPADAAGKWEAQMVMTGGHAFSFSQKHIFEVVERPYLAILSPGDETVPLGEGVTVEAQIMLNGTPLNVEEYFSDPPMNLLIAQVKELPGEASSGAVFLQPEDTDAGLFSGYIPAGLSVEGTGKIAVQLKGQHRADGAVVLETEAAPFRVGMSSGQKRAAALKKAALVVAAILAAALAVLFLWYLRLPRIRRYDAHLSFATVSGDTQEVPLTGRKLAVFRPRLSASAAVPDSPAEEEPGRVSNNSTPKRPAFCLAYAKRKRGGSDDDDIAEENPTVVLLYGMKPIVLFAHEERHLAPDGSYWVVYE